MLLHLPSLASMQVKFCEEFLATELLPEEAMQGSVESAWMPESSRSGID